VTALVLALLILCLGLALALRPWRLLRCEALLSPMLACLVLLPWLWALPRLHAMPLQLQLSGAVMATLCLGWPLAVPTLVLVALIADGLAPQPWPEVLGQAFYLGVLPASLTLGLGAVLRRYLPAHPFIYILGRGFLGAAACMFGARVAMTLLAAPALPVGTGLSLVADWLMAWGDAFLTGLITAILVAFRPQWLATWSDPLYLRPPPA
jgi:uncharacterized membrane protein